MEDQSSSCTSILCNIARISYVMVILTLYIYEAKVSASFLLHRISMCSALLVDPILLLTKWFQSIGTAPPCPPRASKICAGKVSRLRRPGIDDAAVTRFQVSQGKTVLITKRKDCPSLIEVLNMFISKSNIHLCRTIHISCLTPATRRTSEGMAAVTSKNSCYQHQSWLKTSESRQSERNGVQRLECLIRAQKCTKVLTSTN